MGNLSYCRFQNTAEDLAECQEHLVDDLGGQEWEARERLVQLCRDIADEIIDNG